jgi:hypothetical protein
MWESKGDVERTMTLLTEVTTVHKLIKAAAVVVLGISGVTSMTGCVLNSGAYDYTCGTRFDYATPKVGVSGPSHTYEYYGACDGYTGMIRVNATYNTATHLADENMLEINGQHRHFHSTMTCQIDPWVTIHTPACTGVSVSGDLPGDLLEPNGYKQPPSAYVLNLVDVTTLSAYLSLAYAQAAQQRPHIPVGPVLPGGGCLFTNCTP